MTFDAITVPPLVVVLVLLVVAIAAASVYTLGYAEGRRAGKRDAYARLARQRTATVRSAPRMAHPPTPAIVAARRAYAEQDGAGR